MSQTMEEESGDQQEQVVLIDGAPREVDIRMQTPERNPPQKRRAGDAQLGYKQRRSMEPDVPDSPESKLRRMDDEEMDSLNELDRKMLASAIMGVDITEMFSPERVNLWQEHRLILPMDGISPDQITDNRHGRR